MNLEEDFVVIEMPTIDMRYSSENKVNYSQRENNDSITKLRMEPIMSRL